MTAKRIHSIRAFKRTRSPVESGSRPHETDYRPASSNARKARATLLDNEIEFEITVEPLAAGDRRAERQSAGEGDLLGDFRSV